MRLKRILMAAALGAALLAGLTGCTVVQDGIEIPVGDGWVEVWTLHGVYGYHKYGQPVGGPIVPTIPTKPEWWPE